MIAPPQDEPGELHVVAETDEIAALCLEGEFDLANAQRIIEEGERLLAANKQVILDLSGATFIDSSVQALSRVAEARKNGRVVVLQLGTAAIVERVIEISSIERLLPRASTDPRHTTRSASYRVPPPNPTHSDPATLERESSCSHRRRPSARRSARA